MRIWLLILALIMGGRCDAYQYQLSICAIFQDEAPYLKEWIEFHQLVGVEHFYLYNHRSTDDWKTVLAPYIDNGTVELWNENTEALDNRSFNKLQSACYTECLKHTRGVSKWVAFLDIDEYLFPVNDQKLTTFLQRYEDCACLCANWLMFGTSGVKKIPPQKLLIETLTCCTSGTYRENSYVKSIVRPERVTHFLNPHYPQCCDGYSQVNTDKMPFDGPFSTYYRTNQLRINHYWTRDETYFFEKKIPRQCRWGGTPNPDSLLNNMNCGHDELILRYVPHLKKD